MITQKKQFIVNQLDDVPGFLDGFYKLAGNLSVGKVMAYDQFGRFHEPSEEQVVKIQEIEAINSEYNFSVYAILEDKSLGLDIDCYLIVSTEGDDVEEAGEGSYYAMSVAVNKSWGLEDYGSIVIASNIAGNIIRV